MTDANGQRKIRVKCPKCGKRRLMSSSAEKMKCSCGRSTEWWIAITCAMKDTDLVTDLSKNGPRSGVHKAAGNHRFLIKWITKPKISGVLESPPGYSGFEQIAYLPGQERAAVTLLIEENEEFVKHAITTTSPLLKEHLGEHMWMLLVEQWIWSEREWPDNRRG